MTGPLWALSHVGASVPAEEPECPGAGRSEGEGLSFLTRSGGSEQRKLSEKWGPQAGWGNAVLGRGAEPMEEAPSQDPLPLWGRRLGPSCQPRPPLLLPRCPFRRGSEGLRHVLPLRLAWPRDGSCGCSGPPSLAAVAVVPGWLRGTNSHPERSPVAAAPLHGSCAQSPDGHWPRHPSQPVVSEAAPARVLRAPEAAGPAPEPPRMPAGVREPVPTFLCRVFMSGRLHQKGPPRGREWGQAQCGCSGL